MDASQARENAAREAPWRRNEYLRAAISKRKTFTQEINDSIQRASDAGELKTEVVCVPSMKAPSYTSMDQRMCNFSWIERYIIPDFQAKGFNVTSDGMDKDFVVSKSIYLSWRPK